MPNPKTSAWYRLFRVYLIFAHHAASDFEKLRTAYYEYLIDIRPDVDLPSDLREEFKRIMSEAGAIMLNGNGTSADNIERARRLAYALRDVYFNLRQVNIDVRQRADPAGGEPPAG